MTVNVPISVDAQLLTYCSHYVSLLGFVTIFVNVWSTFDDGMSLKANESHRKLFLTYSSSTIKFYECGYRSLIVM